MKINKVIIPVVSLCSLLLFAPLDIYSANIEEFSFDLYDIIKLMIPISIIAIAIMLSLFSVINHISRKFYFYILIILFVTFISLFVQGMFFSSSISVIDGRSIDWAQYKFQNIFFLVIWFLLLFVCFFIYHSRGEKVLGIIIKYASVLLFCFSLISSITALALNGGFKDKSDYIISSDGLSNYSSNENFIILVVDTTDSAVFNNLLDIHNEYEEIFRDFTYFENSMSLFGCTKFSVPLILTGNTYKNEEPFIEYQKKAYSTSPLFEQLSDAGYQIGLYEPELPQIDFFPNNTINVKRASSSRFSNPILFIKMQLKLSGLKYLPFFLKEYCTLSTDNIYYDSLKETDGKNAFSWQNDYFFDFLQNNEITLIPNHVFKFIHISGSHLPYDEYNSKINGITGNTYETSTEATVTVINTFLQQLKGNGIYDNSNIIILADHGFLGSYGTGHQNPVLFVKGTNEHHSFSISHAPISYIDLLPAYSKLLSGSHSDEIFDWHDGDIRTRYFYSIYITDDNHMYEFSHCGHASDESAMVETGNIFIKP